VKGRPRSFVLFVTKDTSEVMELPKRVWGTNSHEFYVLLSVLLHKLQPKSLLELGSGRTTIYLSEYAGKRGAKLVSVEQNPEWVAFNRLVCRIGRLSEQFVQYVPLQDDGFYSVGRLSEIVERPDFVFIDGPAATEARTSQVGFLTSAVSAAKLILVDDVQRSTVHEMVSALESSSGCSNRAYLRYKPRRMQTNWLCFLYHDDVAPVVQGAIEYLGIEVSEEYEPPSAGSEGSSATS
jgi:predicted O-methyltransferase YrrM